VQGKSSVKGAKFAFSNGLCPKEESILKRFGAIFD
jgi:hypothetical protein